LEYIKQAVKDGVEKDEIRNHLSQNGVGDDAIRKIIQRLVWIRRLRKFSSPICAAIYAGLILIFLTLLLVNITNPSYNNFKIVLSILVGMGVAQLLTKSVWQKYFYEGVAKLVVGNNIDYLKAATKAQLSLLAGFGVAFLVILILISLL